MRWLAGIAVLLSVALLNGATASADASLQLQPLQYVETLRKGEQKQGYIDVSNPSTQPIVVEFNVQAFRQIDDKGSLVFYEDEIITSGITLDYQEKEIPEKKTLRLFFKVDGTKLPPGDVFAAIFAQTKPIESAMIPSVRVGTVLMLTNGSPGVRQATIESLSLPLFHLGESIAGVVRIKNTAPGSSASGFFPKINIRTWPFGSNTAITGPLIYAGNTRTVDFDIPSSQLGVYKVSASYGNSTKEQWIIVMTGLWRWLAITTIIGIIVAVFFLKFVYKRRSVRR